MTRYRIRNVAEITFETTGKRIAFQNEHAAERRMTIQNPFRVAKSFDAAV